MQREKGLVLDKPMLKPSLLVFAGPNGFGKSTIKSLFEIKGQYTNADDIETNYP